MLSDVSGRCGELAVVVYLLNDSNTPVANNLPLWDTALRANGQWLHPTLKTTVPREMIAPGAFTGPVRFTASIPTELSGKGELQLGALPTVTFTFDTLNRCPAA